MEDEVIIREPVKNNKVASVFAKIISYVIFVTWTFLTIAPVIWMCYSSFKTNEELSRNIYSLPHRLFHEKGTTYKVVKPSLDTKYPDDLFERFGIKKSSEIDKINANILILGATDVAVESDAKVFFLIRDELPDDLVFHPGHLVKHVDPVFDKNGNQKFINRRVPKMDENGNVIKDKKGNTVYTDKPVPEENVYSVFEEFDTDPIKLKDAQYKDGYQINYKDLPKKLQRKYSWESIWWNYSSAWQRGKLGPKFVNSIIYTVVSTFFVVLLGLMLGYGVTKFKYKKAASIVSAVISLGYLIDVSQLIVPLFLMLTSMNLTNTHIGIILVYTAFGLPMSVMLAATFIRGLPDSLVESAYIDGATPFRTFISIVVPMTAPVIVTIGIMSALGVWNEFLLVLVLSSQEATKSLPVGVFSFSSRTGNQMGWQVAALVIATIPIVIVYFIFQKKIAEGVAGGALKE